MAFSKVISAAVASTALVFSGMTPAMAAPIGPATAPATPIAIGELGWSEEASTANGWRSNRGYRGYRGHRHRRHRNRVDAGDIIAGIAILGGIAAIASAASKNKRDKRDRRYEDRREDNRDYRNDRQSSNYNSGGLNQAVSACSDAAERNAGDRARVSEIRSVTRDGQGWRVEGFLTNAAQPSFLCGATDGRVDFVQLGTGDLAYAN